MPGLVPGTFLSFPRKRESSKRRPSRSLDALVTGLPGSSSLCSGWRSQTRVPGNDNGGSYEANYFYFSQRQPMTKYWLLAFCHSSALSPAVLRQLTTSAAVAPGTGFSEHSVGVDRRQINTTS